MGTHQHNMAKHRRRSNQRDGSVYVFTVRDLQNGIGIAGVVGIAFILALLGLDSGSSSSPPAPTAARLPTTPFTLTVGDGSSSGASVSLLPTVTPPSTATLPSSSSGSSVSPGGTNPHSASNTAGSKSTVRTSTSNASGPSSAGAVQIQGPPTTTTTTTAPPVSTSSTSTTTTNTTTTTTTLAPGRVVEGTAVTLGSGQFVGGTDVMPGLYDVTVDPGESGRFIVTGADSYNEALDSSGSAGVPEVRVQISTGDQIQISALSTVSFTPVTTPFITTYGTVTLYAGTWTVGQDLGPGTYVATPAAGQSGLFVIEKEGLHKRLNGNPGSGTSGSVTFTVQNGDVISISGLSQVTLSAS